MRSSTLTVYFEGPFWVAVLERSDPDGYQVARLVLGAEPSDAELFVWLRDHSDRFVFGPPLAGASVCPPEQRSAQRAQREARKEARRSPGTKAQRALAEAREGQKTIARQRSRTERDAEEAQKRALKDLKKKEKHRGH